MAKWFGTESVSESAELAEVKAENAALAGSLEILQENMADIVMAMDNQGWNPLGEELDMSEIPLYTIKKTARTTRALGVINPLVTRGLSVRNAYIWGGGISFEGLDEKDPFFASTNAQKYFFSLKARSEMETALGTDGNFFLLVTKAGLYSKGSHKVQRIPLYQITGTVSDPDNHEDIWFYRREWVTVVNDRDTEAVAEKLNIEYFPAIDYDPVVNGRPTTMRGYPVRYNSVIAHHTAKKQIGWKWGIPDLMSVIFWAKAHKEFLENQATLVKAYSRFAFKVTTPTTNGAKGAATKVAQQPTRNPMTGEPNDVGGTFMGSMGATLSSVGRTGGSVDFKAGLPLAGYVAAGLNVPLNELTADAGDANRSSAETLSSSNEKVMKERQEEHKAFFESVLSYLGYEDVEVKFPPITLEAVYRQIQSIVQIAALNIMSAEEIRDLALKAFGIETDAGVPTEEELGNLILAMKQAEEQAQMQADAKANQPDTANPSYGDNSHRSDAGQHAYSDGKNG